ncbi:MAG: DUF4214 domain-containing protein [Gemmataceae bacterium]
MSRQHLPSPGRARQRARPLGLERLEDRTVPSVSITGQAFHANGAVTPPTAPPDPGVANVTVFLDANANGRLDAGETSTQTNADGNYSFTGLAAGDYTVAAQPPAGLKGFSAQAQAFRVSLPDGATFGNLNFALTGQSQALVRNVFERVLIRPVTDAYQTNVSGRLTAGTLTPGAYLNAIVGSAEFGQVVAPLAGVLAGFFPGQPVDPNLLRANVQLLRVGITPDAAVLNVLYSQKFVAALGDTSLLNNEAFTRLVYQRLLRRAPAAAELASWNAALTAGTFNRGQMILRVTSTPTFALANPDLGNRVAVSMAYLGLLGRPADPVGFPAFLRFLNAGGTLTALGNALANSAEYRNAKGFTDLFLSDVQAQQVKPAVGALSRLQLYNPTTQQFDTPVAAQSLTGLTKVNGQNAPANVYFVAHGWAPGYAEDVALHSTPGNPLKVWQTVQFPGGLGQQGPDSPWLFGGVNEVSAEGFAEAITNVDPNAVVIAYSWIDESATAGLGAIGLDDPTPLLLGGQSEAYTQLNGLRLADAVQQALAPSFFLNKGLMHLLGHSHGSKVATVAALALQQAGVAVSHLTAMESPEDGPNLILALGHVPGLVGAQNFLWYYLQQMALGQTPVGPNRAPQQAGGKFQTFVDNYLSLFGFGSPLGGYPGLGTVADVLLQSQILYPLPTNSSDPDFDQQLAAALFGAHDYPPPWYAQASLETLGTGSANALNWSPLLNPASTPAGGGYVQTWDSNVFNQQFALSGNGPATPTTPAFSPLSYATNYTVGQVAQNANSITLGANGTDALSLLAMSFTPLSATGASGQLGTGMDFQFQFNNASEGDQLVFWVRGDVGLESPRFGVDSGELGYRTMPLFVMDAKAAGAGTHGATVSLDAFANNPSAVLQGAFGATKAPQFGFSLIRSANSTATVTVSQLRQFTDGTGG